MQQFEIRETTNAVLRDTLARFKSEYDASTLTGKEMLKTMGLDSLDVMEIIMGVEERVGVRIPSSKIHDIHRLEDIYLLFEEAA